MNANQLSGMNNTRFGVVRYGNVFASRGSVVPYFKNLIKKGVKKLPITDLEMTRFVITIEQGIELVIKSFLRMHGGEIFVPKTSSIKIIDLKEAMLKERKFKVIGIRPGEKLHEVLCPSDDSHLTYDFKDHYVIAPAIKFFSSKNQFNKNNLKERGKLVKKGFEYSSGKNNKFLNIKAIKKLLSR